MQTSLWLGQHVHVTGHPCGQLGRSVESREQHQLQDKPTTKITSEGIWELTPGLGSQI